MVIGCIPYDANMAQKVKKYNLITVDEHKIQTIIDVYFQWKTLDTMLSTLNTR